MEKQTPNCRAKEDYLSFLIHKIQIYKIFTMISKKMFTTKRLYLFILFIYFI